MNTDEETVLLWVARETGALDALLERAETVADVADETDLDGRTARIITHALADRGFLERVGESYEPTNRLLGFLTRTDVRSIGTRPHAVDLLDRYRRLPAALARDEVPDDPDHWTVHRLGAVAATDEATVRALVTAAERVGPDADRVLDVGGAPGVFAKEFVRRGFAVELCDTPDALGPTRPFLATEPIEVTETAIPPDSLPDADLVFVPDLAHRLSPAANQTLLAAARDALDCDGAVVLTSYVRGRSSRAPAVALSALASTEGGEVYPADRFREWLRAADFSDVDVRNVPGTDRQAIVGRVE